MFGLSTIKLIGIFGAALFLLALFADRVRWMGRAHVAEAQVTAACNATKDAAANKKLACKDMPQQIRLLGTAITDLKAGIANQNAAISDLGAKTVQAQAETVQASQRAATRAHEAEATSERLRASARSAVPSSAPCKPSKTLEEVWR